MTPEARIRYETMLDHGYSHDSAMQFLEDNDYFN
jgi:hypothetical protein